MGQRLNLEILETKNGVDNILANAYYHWSGYTSSAIRLTEKAIESIFKTKNLEKSDDRRLLAICILG